MILICVLGALCACGGQEAAEPAPEEPEATPLQGTEAAPEESAEPPEEAAEPSGPPKRIFAKRFVVPVRTGPSRAADRIGYLRGGAVLMATHAEPVPDAPERRRCRSGWYELTTGGFVCNGRDVIPFEGEELPAIRGRQPSREDTLPYEYGFIRHRVPQFRRIPTGEDLAELRGAAEAAREAAAAEAASESAMAESAMTESAMTESAMTESAMTESAMEAMAEMAVTHDPEPAPSETGTNLETTSEDAGGPTLETLQGEDGSVVMRYLMRGFFVSLDREFNRGGRRYWRTQANGFVPFGAVLERSGSEYAGVVLPPSIVGGEPGGEGAPSEDEGPAESGAEGGTGENGDEAEPEEPVFASPVLNPRLPYAWVLSSRSRAYQQTSRGGFRRARGEVDYHEGFAILEEVERDGRTYLHAGDNRWFRERDVRVARQRERRPRHRRLGEVGPTDKWLDINLAEQTLVAYEGDTPVFATVISSGKRVAGEDWETLTGLFRVKSKHLTDTMDGDTAVDGPYSVDDVPYVMYFELAYALHSAFWHNGFGRPRSHGCVNLSPHDARWVFNWADPPLPENWHSVYPTEETPGTWIFVHGETPTR
ncbi:MAG: L,D-transpeptidase [Myxococcota bacterium]